MSFVSSHSKTRCVDQPYLIAVGCMCVCILCSSIRTGCLAPYVRSVRGSWENKVVRGLLCYCYLPPPEPCLKTGNRSQTAVRGACGNGLYSNDLWSIISIPACSLTPLPWPSNTLPWAWPQKTTDLTRPSPARLGLTQPSTIDCAFWDLFEWAMKNRWTLRKGRRGGGG